MLPTGIRIQLIWILCTHLIIAHAYYFNNGYMAFEENREEPSTGNYNFGYSERHENANSYRREKRVGNRVTGEYGFRLPDGRMRVTKYIADENGYRTVVDSNEMANQNQQPNDWNVEQFESERLQKLRTYEKEQLTEQKRQLNEQIRLQEQIQENEIRRQNNELENSIMRENNEQTSDNVYVAPLPAIEIERQSAQSIEKQREEYKRASQQWIREQQKHYEEQQKHYEEQQIAKQKAIEKKEQEESIEKIRQQQLIMQQRIWSERQSKRQRKQNEKSQNKEKSIERRIESANFVEQQKETNPQSIKNLKEEQWWFRENERQTIQSDSDRSNEKLIEPAKEEHKIDIKAQEVTTENVKNDRVQKTELDKTQDERVQVKGGEQRRLRSESNRVNIENDSKQQKTRRPSPPISPETLIEKRSK